MNIKLLEALIYVHRHGTFKKAAEALYFESPGKEYITPESIQYRLKQLEGELGVSLYLKKQGSTHVRLTREGLLFLNEALDVHQRMLDWRGHFLDSPGGVLEIASTQTVLINRLQPLLQQYHAQHPDVIIRARGTDSPDMERLVAQGCVDLALSTRPPADPDLDYAIWMRTELRVVTPKGHPLSSHPKASLEEIAAHPMVLLTHEPGGDRELLDQALRLRGIEARRVVLETNNSEILLAYVESGMGITITSATNLLRNRRDVESVALAESIGSSEVGLLVRKHQHHPARARHLVRLLDPKLEAWLDRHRAPAPDPSPDPAPRKRKPRVKA